VTRQDDTTIGVRQVLLLAAHVLTVFIFIISKTASRAFSSLDLVGAADHSTFERRSSSSTDFPPAYQSEPRRTRGGPDKAIRRCKAGGRPETTIAVVRISCEIATFRSTHEEERVSKSTISAAASQSNLHEADSQDRFEQSS
jgi:hypothetical protein